MNVNGSDDPKILFFKYVCALVLYRCNLLTQIRYGRILLYALEMGLSTFRIGYKPQPSFAIILHYYAAPKDPLIKVTKWGDPCTSSDLSTRW